MCGIGLQNYRRFKLALIQGQPVTWDATPTATAHLFTYSPLL